jgi:hypothetical protein
MVAAGCCADFRAESGGAFVTDAAKMGVLSRCTAASWLANVVKS